MDVSTSIAIAVLLLGYSLMFVVALAEVSLATISRVHVHQLSEEGSTSAHVIEVLLADAERFFAGILVLRTAAIGSVLAALTWLLVRWRYDSWLIWGLLIASGLLVLIQVIGRLLAVQHPMTIALNIAPMIRILVMITAPVTWILLRIARGATIPSDSTTRSIFLSEDGLRLLINFAEEERFIEAEEREMIDSIFRFSEMTVEEVMIPRVDVVALSQDATLQEALETIVVAGHSRIPIYEDSIDKIVGILYAKDLLTCYRDGRNDVSVSELMRVPYFVPESAMVDDLLGDLQHKKTHLAIVVDEYGGTAGIVTIEDLLEEIVGEIQDEYDSEPPMLQRVDEGVYLANGRVDIDDLNRDLDLHLRDQDESYTLAGVILSHLQRVPNVGDTLDMDRVHLEVLAVNDNRIEQVRLSIRPLEPDTGFAETGEPIL